MARSCAPALSCPVCVSPLVEIRLGTGLALRSCSTCDGRWWQRDESPAAFDEVLAVVGASDLSRRTSPTG